MPSLLELQRLKNNPINMPRKKLRPGKIFPLITAKDGSQYYRPYQQLQNHQYSPKQHEQMETIFEFGETSTETRPTCTTLTQPHHYFILIGHSDRVLILTSIHRA
jgi:hypothetical protein